MNRILFWDVDTQLDFMVPNGKLHIPAAEAIVGNLARLTRFARERGIRIVASVDDHRLEDEEIALKNPDFLKTFPPHCLHGTPGQEKVPETRPRNPLPVESRPYPSGDLEDRVAKHDGEVVIHKQKVDVFTNPNTERVLAALDPRHVVVYGVALDVRDRYAVAGLLARSRTVHLVRDAACAIHPEEGDKVMEDWRARGVGITTTGDVVDGSYLVRLA